MMASSSTSDWQSLRFETIASSVTDRIEDPSSSGLDHYVGLEHLDPDTLDIARWGSPSDVESTKLRFQPGDVIYARRRAYQRKLGVARWEGVCSAHALVLRARSEACLDGFLPYFLQSDQFHQRALDISVGSLSPTINWKTLAKEEFLIPGLDWQAQVVAALDTAAEARSKARDVALNLATLEDAVIERATWDEDAQDWRVPPTPVGELLLEKPRNGISPKVSASGGALRSVTLSAVRDGRFTASEETEKWCEPKDKSERFIVRSGDVFAVRGNGNRSLVGRAGWAATEPAPPSIYPDLLIRLRFDPSKVDPFLATKLWNSRRVHGQLLQRAKSTSGIYKVNGKDLAAHQLPVPHDEQLQSELLDDLKSVDDLRDASLAAEVDAARLLSALRESLLVPPEDERV